MRTINFAKRNIKEILRDPLSIIFALVLPLFLLFLFQQFKIPNSVYELNNFTPSIIVFGFSFVTMFTAMLVAKDRTSSFLVRLCASPMKSVDFIFGYILALLPIVFLQLILFFSLAVILGLVISIGILWAILSSIIFAILFISIGILIGSFLSEKGSAGLASGVVQIVAFTSGMWFSSDMVGNFFTVLCDIFPFEGCVNILRGFLTNSYVDPLKSCLVFIAWTLAVTIMSVFFFSKRMMSDNK